MNLIQALQIIGKLTDSVILTPEASYFTDDAHTFFAEIKCQVPSKVGFYKEIANFNKMAALFVEPNININGHSITLTEGSDSAQFVGSDVSIIEASMTTEQMKGEVLKTLGAPSVCAIEIDEHLLNRIKSASSIIENSSLILNAEVGGDIRACIKDTDILSAESHSVNLKLEGETTKDFNIEIDASIFSKLPKGDIKLEIKYSERTGNHRVMILHDWITAVIASANV